MPNLEADGRKLTRSAAIMLHLAQQHGAFGGATEEERYEVLRWLFFDNHKFTRYFAMAAWWQGLQATPGWKPPYEMLPGAQVSPRW